MSDKVIRCRFCGRTFTDSTEFLYHLWSEHREIMTRHIRRESKRRGR